MYKAALIILFLFIPSLFIQNSKIEFLHFVYIHGFHDIRITDSENNLIDNKKTFNILMDAIFASIYEFETMINRTTKKAVETFEKKLHGFLKKLRTILKTINSVIILSFRKILPVITSKFETPVIKIAIGFLTFSSVYLFKTYPLRC